MNKSFAISSLLAATVATSVFAATTVLTAAPSHEARAPQTEKSRSEKAKYLLAPSGKTGVYRVLPIERGAPNGRRSPSVV